MDYGKLIIGSKRKTFIDHDYSSSDSSDYDSDSDSDSTCTSSSSSDSDSETESDSSDYISEPDLETKLNNVDLTNSIIQALPPATKKQKITIEEEKAPTIVVPTPSPPPPEEPTQLMYTFPPFFQLKKTTTLLEFQKDDLNKVMNQGFRIICNEMGTGKTLIGLLISLNYNNRTNKPSLIVSSETIQLNWKKELDTHFDYDKTKVLLLTSSTIKERYDFSKYTLILATYDALNNIILAYNWFLYLHNNELYDYERDLLKIKSDHPIRQCKTTYMNFKNFDFVTFVWASILIDEAHKFQNATSLWYKTSKTLYSNDKILMTATPVTNGIKNFINLLKWLNIKYTDKEKDIIIKKYVVCTNRQDVPELREIHEALKMDICVYIESDFFDHRERKDYDKLEELFIRDIKRLGYGGMDSEEYMEIYGIILKHILNMRQATISYHLTAGVDECKHIMKNIEDYESYTTYESTKIKMAVKKYEEYRTGVVFCCEYTSALTVLDYALRKKGYTTTYINSKDKKVSKQLIDNWNKDSSSALLISLCGYSEGYDLPAARYMIALNSTFLSTKAQQFFGRAMRSARVVDPVTKEIIQNKCIGITLLIAGTIETDYVYLRGIQKIFENSDALSKIEKASKDNAIEKSALNIENLRRYMNCIVNNAVYKNYKIHQQIQRTIDESSMNIDQIKQCLYENFKSMIDSMITSIINERTTDRNLLIDTITTSCKRCTVEFFTILDSSRHLPHKEIPFKGPVEKDYSYKLRYDSTSPENPITFTLKDTSFQTSKFMMQPVYDTLFNYNYPYIDNVIYCSSWLHAGHIRTYILVAKTSSEVDTIDLKSVKNSFPKKSIKEDHYLDNIGFNREFLQTIYKTRVNQENIDGYCKNLIDNLDMNLFKMTLHDGRTMTIHPICVNSMLEKLNLTNSVLRSKVDELLELDNDSYNELIEKLNNMIFIVDKYVNIPCNSKINIIYDRIENRDLEISK